MEQLRDSNQECENSRNSETPIAIGGSDFGDGNKASSTCSVRVCRVCHMSAKESVKSTVDLIELGCGCRGELGFAHLQCAEAWFKLKGNRSCEICDACNRCRRQHFHGVEREEMEDGSNAISGGSSRCLQLQGQPLCNFLMDCLVIAFILPGCFHVNFF